MSRAAWPAADVRMVLRLYKSGMTAREVTSTTGVPLATVLRWVKRAGLSRRRGPAERTYEAVVVRRSIEGVESLAFVPMTPYERERVAIALRTVSEQARMRGKEHND